jgi:hypothetical protein
LCQKFNFVASGFLRSTENELPYWSQEATILSRMIKGTGKLKETILISNFRNEIIFSEKRYLVKCSSYIPQPVISVRSVRVFRNN